jgi:hypothetical protein
MSVKSVESQGMWAVVENQNLSGVVASTAGQQQPPAGGDVPWLNRTSGKFALGAGCALIAGGLTYAYCKSQFGQPKP